MSDTISSQPAPALSTLSEEEEMFREAVRDFAETEIAPRAGDMVKNQAFDADLLPQLFELGLMGIEVPEDMGGAGSTFFTSILVHTDVMAGLV